MTTDRSRRAVGCAYIGAWEAKYAAQRFVLVLGAVSAFWWGAAQAQVAPSIQGIPPAERYLPYGVAVPAMVLKDTQGNVLADQRQDRARVAHVWKKFAHHATPASMQDSITYGSLFLSTFWGIDSAWTGDLATCKAGNVSRGIIEASVRQANWYRSMAGLAPTARVNLAAFQTAQLAALVNRGAVSVGQPTGHTPTSSTPCYSVDAANAALASLITLALSLGQRGPAAVDAFIDDGGPENGAAGHRRNILHPLRGLLNYGEASAPLDTFSYAAAIAFPTSWSDTQSSAVVETLWPNEGFMPYQAYPWSSNRWSMACTGCDFTGAMVSVKRNGTPIQTTLESLVEGYSDQPTLVWKVAGVDYSHFVPHDTAVFTQDDVFDTTVTYKQNGVAKTRTYRTTVFNPELEQDFSPPFDLTDMWWNPNESGWGLDLLEGTKGNLFGTVYFYDSKGNQRWVTLQNTSWTAPGQVSWTVYETKGPSFASHPFDPSQVTVRNTGSATMTFSTDTSTATFTMTVDGQTTVKQVRRFAEVPIAYGNGVNYRGMWWNPAESGWGISVAQQYQTLFSVIFTYDTDGSLLWVVMPGGTWTSEFTYEGKLYVTRQAPWDPSSFNPSAQQTVEAGTFKFTFSDANHGTLDYTIKDVTDHKVIEKYTF